MCQGICQVSGKLPCVVKLDARSVMAREEKAFTQIKAYLGDHAPRVLDSTVGSMVGGNRAAVVPMAAFIESSW